ncbi:MAG: hypothetical protein PHP52_01935 [Bacteroidales bacterium]|nr:hypothetical protein [Bacteroidales bacterium]MDD4217479.1 hypothetical protein [Bacteroidales bacterium]MDY0143020.1 hypothetical protein [Bacteroidales bacterium]
MMKITKDISIDILIDEIPQSMKYLSEKGIRCIICGEPIWGTLESAAKEKGFTDAQIETFVIELQSLAPEK